MLKTLFYAGVCLTPALAAAVDFKRDIAPIFKSKCYSCHSEEAGKEKSGYVFDNLERLAGDIRPSGMIEPGSPEESPLMELLTLPVGDKRRMPPKGDGLTDKEVKLMREWIKDGAPLTKKAATKTSGLTPKKDPKEPEKPDKPEKPAKPPEAPAPETGVAEKWTSVDGKVISAVFVRVEGDAVLLRMNGMPYRVPLNKLAEESRKRAQAK